MTAGRPPFKPTAKQRKSVEIMRACGEKQRTIAKALAIDEDTLKKHFADELENGWSRQRNKVLEMIFEGARKGNATLMKRADELTRMGLAPPEDQLETAPIPAHKLAKKEAVRQAAIAASQDAEWGDDLRLPPDALN